MSLTSNDLPFSFSESKTAILLTVNRDFTSMHADIYANENLSHLMLELGRRDK